MSSPPLQDARPLNRLFRMAVVAGVEGAVRLHVHRGDDLNARDDKGFTPLMLAAARNKASICRLLLDAGADARMLDPTGRNALAIARDAGATDAVAVIKSALADEPEPNGESHEIAETPREPVEEPPVGLSETPIPDLCNEPPAFDGLGHHEHASEAPPVDEQPASGRKVSHAKVAADSPHQAQSAPIDAPDPDFPNDEEAPFDLSAWEAEGSVRRPKATRVTPLSGARGVRISPLARQRAWRVIPTAMGN